MRLQPPAVSDTCQTPQVVTVEHTRRHKWCHFIRVSSRVQRRDQVTRAAPKEYLGSDGRRKSTMEEAFTVSVDGSVETSSPDGRPPPWGIGWQTNERDIAWDGDLKERLIKVLGYP